MAARAGRDPEVVATGVAAEHGAGSSVGGASVGGTALLGSHGERSDEAEARSGQLTEYRLDLLPNEELSAEEKARRDGRPKPPPAAGLHRVKRIVEASKHGFVKLASHQGAKKLVQVQDFIHELVVTLQRRRLLTPLACLTISTISYVTASRVIAAEEYLRKTCKDEPDRCLKVSCFTRVEEVLGIFLAGWAICLIIRGLRIELKAGVGSKSSAIKECGLVNSLNDV